MLSSVRVQGYRCFEDLQYAPLRRVNLIGGVNNIGKTALLESIFLLAGGNNPSLSTKVNIFRGIDSFVLKPAEIWGNLFRRMDISRPIIVEGQHPGGLTKLTITMYSPEELVVSPTRDGEEVAARAGLVYELQHGGQVYTIRGSIRVEAGEKGGISVVFSPIVTTPIFQGVFVHTGGGSPALDADRYSALDKQDAQEGLRSLLNSLKILEPRLQRLSVITGGQVRAIHGALDGTTALLPLSVMGGGMVRLASLLLAIHNSQNGIVLIDEIENGLHHSVMPKVWRALSEASRDANVQLFATTHSYECIQSALTAFGEQQDNFGYSRLENVGGKIKAVPYEREVIEAAVDENVEVR